MNWSNRTYDTIKWVCLLALPALATLVLALANVWGIPYGSEIAATITAVNAFLGGATGISSSNYAKKSSDGTIYVEDDGSAYAQFQEPIVDKAGNVIKMDVQSLSK